MAVERLVAFGAGYEPAERLAVLAAR